jgi:hypothetical protein
LGIIIEGASRLREYVERNVSAQQRVSMGSAQYVTDKWFEARRRRMRRKGL